MEGYHDLTPEERARVTEIQDLLIVNPRFAHCTVFGKKEALEEDKKARAREIEFEIKELRQEIETIKEWGNV